MAWEKVEVPQGTFIGWGRVGQGVVGKVRDFSIDGGRDFAGGECPLLTVELTAEAENYADKGTTQSKIDAGELVSITAGQANLRRTLIAARPAIGDLIGIVYSGNYKTANGTGKEFDVRIDRGAAVDVQEPSTPAAVDTADFFND